MTKQRQSRSKSILKGFLLFLTILGVIALLLSYAASFISPAKILFFAFFGLAYPLILIYNVIFILVWLFLWKKYFWIPFFAVLLGYAWIGSVAQSGMNMEAAAAGSLKVISFNVHNLEGSVPKNRDKSIPLKVSHFILIERPDLLCLQEFRMKTEDTSKFLGMFREQTHLNYYYFKNYSGKGVQPWVDAMVIFSRYPIVRSGFLATKKHVYASFADIGISDDTVRLLNVHFESIRFQNADYDFYSTLTETELNRLEVSKGVGNITKKLSKAFIARASQVEELEKSLSASPYPVIICGDFNDTPSSFTYERLTRKYYDSFRKAGSGFMGSTYAGSLPSFRIDYILYDKAFTAYEYRHYKVGLSDHYPITVYINLTPAR